MMPLTHLLGRSRVQRPRETDNHGNGRHYPHVSRVSLCSEKLLSGVTIIADKLEAEADSPESARPLVSQYVFLRQPFQSTPDFQRSAESRPTSGQVNWGSYRTPRMVDVLLCNMKWGCLSGLSPHKVHRNPTHHEFQEPLASHCTIEE